jgi:hypothetical protein
MSLLELPFGFPGRVFRSPMPFGPYDLHGEVYDRFCEEQITVIVLLASDEECLHKTGCNLRALYLTAGFQVLYLDVAILFRTHGDKDIIYRTRCVR